MEIKKLLGYTSIVAAGLIVASLPIIANSGEIVFPTNPGKVQAMKAGTLDCLDGVSSQAKSTEDKFVLYVMCTNEIFTREGYDLSVTIAKIEEGRLRKNKFYEAAKRSGLADALEVQTKLIREIPEVHDRLVRSGDIAPSLVSFLDEMEGQ